MSQIEIDAGRVRTVSTCQELLDVVSDTDVKLIMIANDISGLSEVRLAAGVELRGVGNAVPTLRFVPGAGGVRLSADNTVADFNIYTDDDQCAISNDESIDSLGTLAITRVNTRGRVCIIARNNVRHGHVTVEALDIISADSRSAADKPHEYGVDVLQGAFTLWNMQSDESVVITADLTDLSAGRFGKPVLGSGIFVSGAGDAGGRLEIQHLRTGPVYSNGDIQPGLASLISGGVFVVYGTRVDLVENVGPVTTYGSNDMALDNWGLVDRWVSKEKVTTFGPSGVGFVNFGRIGKLETLAPIETFGQGARGFNVYTGTIQIADFDRIVTHADGAVGVQISQPIGTLLFRRGIETFGTVGDSLVKGVVVKLAATALSIKPGGSAERIEIRGGLHTHGKDVLPLEQNGRIGALTIEGGFCSADA